MRRIEMASVALVAAMAAACSGGGSGANNGNTTPSLTVTPTEWSVTAGGAAKQFTHTLTGSSDPIVWAIETAGTAPEVGSISATGLYTPPPSLASGRDVVVKATAGALVARATVHLGAAVGGVTLAVTPATASVVAGSTDILTLHADTNYVGTVAWTMGPALGTLDPATGPTVVYTAPSAFVMWGTDVVVTATAGALSDASSITVHPTALVVTGPSSVRTGGAAVDYTLSTDVGANAVAWSLNPASAGSITGTGSTGTFAPAATVASSTPFQVVATVGGATGHASATLLPPATLVTITGTVVSHEGHPYAGAKVVIGAQSTTSGPSGAFSIPGVVPPYDAILITHSNTDVTVFRGVSDVTPVLAFAHFDPYRMATVTGRVTFGPDGVPGAQVFSPVQSTTVYDPDGVYTFATGWFGNASEIVTHRAWGIWTDRVAPYRPYQYWYGYRDVAVTAGATTTGQDIALASLASGHVSGDAGLAPDFEVGSDSLNLGFTMSALFDDGSSRSFYTNDWYLDPIYGAFDFIVPAFPDGTVHLSYRVWAMTGGRSAGAYAPVVAGQTGVALVIPSTPAASAPADGATGVGYATALTWATTNVGGTDGVYITCGNGMSYGIKGGERSSTIPDLRAFGISPRSATCTWSPTWASATIDEEVQGPVALDAIPQRTASGADRSFTFNP